VDEEITVRVAKKLPQIEIERHSLGMRVTHWIHAALITTFILTGLSMYLRLDLFGPNALLIHITSAFIIGLVDFPIHFFFMWRADEFKYLVIQRKEDLLEVFALAKNFVGISNYYPEHATYIPNKGKYYLDKKYCAFQKLLLYSDLLVIILMGATGFSLYYPAIFSPVANLVAGAGNLKALHLLLFYYFSATLIGHVYNSFLPVNWGRFKAMIVGKGDVDVHLPQKVKHQVRPRKS
jgi:cytochrome b subunit of formate dehydrogenase